MITNYSRALAALTVALNTAASVAAANKGISYQIPGTEYEALTEFYFSTKGDQWITKVGWLDPDATEWNGVSVEGVQYHADGNVSVQGHVTSISLDGSGLAGTLPNSLENLTELSYFRVAFNQISGPIPSSLGNLQRLYLLYLHFNNLTGPIPKSLGKLQNLQYLYLRENSLSGTIPEELGDMAQLRVCGLGANRLSGS